MDNQVVYPQSKKKNWIFILVAIVALIILVAVGAQLYTTLLRTQALPPGPEELTGKLSTENLSEGEHTLEIVGRTASNKLFKQEAHFVVEEANPYQAN